MDKYTIEDGQVHVARNDFVFLLTASGISVEFQVLETAQQSRATLFCFGIVRIDHPIELWRTEWDEINEVIRRVECLSQDYRLS